MELFERNLLNIKVLLLSLITSFLISSCSDSNNRLTADEKKEGWQLLFDGKTLDGWRDYNGSALTSSWRVSGGCIFADGKGSDENGYIVTNKMYENFELTWDWKISKAGNSGMLYHVIESPKFPVPYITGPEYMLIDDINFPSKLENEQKCGANNDMYAPDTVNLHINPAGKWNSSKIIFNNGHVSYYLNGKRTIDYQTKSENWISKKKNGKWRHANEYGLANKGVFCLQNHGYPAWFRNIKVRELPAETKNVSLFNGKDLNGWEIYGKGMWYVKDSMLIGESCKKNECGYLATLDYYDDFELFGEFKQESKSSSGVFFRSFIEPGVYINGWKVAIEAKNRKTGGIYESYGRGWLAVPDRQENFFKTGVWNNICIRVHGGNVITWLNGQEMAAIQDDKISKGQGRIALQINDKEKTKIFWKNLHVKTL